jgi:hypothetical protein
MKTLNSLSSYTIAKNCSDITDLNDGVLEIKSAIYIRQKTNKKIPSFYAVRLGNLYDRINKLSLQPSVYTTLRMMGRNKTEQK